MFIYVNSHPGLREVRMMAGAYVASWFINGGKTSLKFGVIGGQVEAHNFPEANGESPHNWFREHWTQKKKNG